MLVKPRLAWRYPGWSKNTGPNDAGYGTFPINRAAFPDREPWLGWVDDSLQEVADAQIRVALAGGLTGFAFNWYYDRANKVSPGDHAIKRFMSSSVTGMDFAIGFESSSSEVPVTNTSDWRDVMARWSEMFAHPAYQRVNGHPVVFVVKLNHFDEVVVPASGMSHRQLLDNARDWTGENIYFVACSEALEYWVNTAKGAGYDCFSAYNLFHTWTQRWGDAVATPMPTKFSELAENYRKEWVWAVGEPMLGREHIWTPGHLPMDYWIPLTVGYDESAWGKSTVITPPTPEELALHFRQARLLMQSPQVVGSVTCAFDENGEGSILQPTKTLGRQRLNVYNRELAR